jgi:hypothetical protein
MNKTAKILLYVFISISVIVAGLALWAYSSRDDIKQYVLSEINKSLKTNIKVESIQVELFRQFPKVGLDFSKVWVEDAFKSKQPLLVAEHIYLGFNFWNILNHNYKIQQITIEDGQVDIHYNKSDQPNFGIFTEGSDTSEMVLNLQKINLNNIDLTYNRKSQKQSFGFTFINQEAKIEIVDSLTLVELEGKTNITHFKLGKTNWVSNKIMDIEASISFNSLIQTFTYDIPSLILGKLSLSLKGNYVFGNKSDNIDLKIRTNEVDIPAILSLFPIKSEILEEWNGEGNVKMMGSIKGPISSKRNPDIDINFDIDNGKLIRKKDNFTLNNITTKANISVSSIKSILQFETFSLKMNKSSVMGSLIIKDFADPYVEAMTSMNMDASDVAALFGITKHQETIGNINSTLEVKGYLKDLTDPQRILNSDIKGAATWDLKNLHPEFSKNKILESTASVTLGSTISITSLVIKTTTGTFTCNGTINNLAGYLFKDKSLEAYLNLSADYLNMNDWIFSSGRSNDEAKVKPYKIVLNSKADRFLYDKIEANSIRAIVSMTPNEIEIESLEANAFEGKLRGEVSVLFDKKGYTIQNNFVVDDANVKTMFSQCNNFYQEEIKDNNLSGTISGNLQMVSKWDTLFRCDYQSLNALLEVEVKDGNIINYEPLKNLSKFADIEDLKNLKIASLQTTVFIRDNKIEIPETDINNNALNLTISGSYKFDGYMDYRIKVRLSELLVKKRKNKIAPEFEEEQDDNKGMYVYLVMQGTTDNLKIFYDKVSVKKKVKQDLQSEKATIKETMKKEFLKEKEPIKETESQEVEFESE